MSKLLVDTCFGEFFAGEPKLRLRRQDEPYLTLTQRKGPAWVELTITGEEDLVGLREFIDTNLKLWRERHK